MADSTVTIVGNLTRDPEIRYTTGGAAKASFGVAVSRRWQNRQSQEWEEQTSFFNVVCWREMAENVAESIGKGSRVVVTGRLEQRSWETDNGDKRSVVEIVADEVGPSLRWATAKVEPQRASGCQRLRWRLGRFERLRWWRWRLRERRRRPAPANPTTPPVRNRSDGTRPTKQQQVCGRRSTAAAEEEDLDPQHRECRLDRLQGRQPAPAVHVGARQDPGASRHRQLGAAATRGRARDPRGARDGVAALQRAAGHPAQGWRSARPRRPGRSRRVA